MRSLDTNRCRGPCPNTTGNVAQLSSHSLFPRAADGRTFIQLGSLLLKTKEPNLGPVNGSFYTDMYIPEKSNVCWFVQNSTLEGTQNLQQLNFQVGVSRTIFSNSTRESKSSWTTMAETTGEGDFGGLPFSPSARPICRFLYARYRSSRCSGRGRFPLCQLPVLPTEGDIMGWEGYGGGRMPSH